MSINRTLSLTVKLNGYKEAIRLLDNLEIKSLEIQSILSNLFSGKSTGGFNVKNTQFDPSQFSFQFTAPIDSTISQVKSKTAKLKEALVALEMLVPVSTNTGMFHGPYSAKQLVARSKNHDNTKTGTLLADLGAFAAGINDVKNLKQYVPQKRGLDPLEELTVANQPRRIKISQEAYAKALADAKVHGSKIQELNKKWETQTVEGKEKTRKQIKALLQKQAKDYQDHLDAGAAATRKSEEEIKELREKATDYLKAGFGMHIVQMYLAPMAAALRQYCSQMLNDYAEFDRKFTDYMVKSLEYGEYLSKNQFYEASVGQTFGLQDQAIAAERFAASGVDVARSQQALTSTLQVATIAHMDYATAANGVVRTMRAMHMEVEQTTEITDALINSANASTAELADLVQWFEYAASASYQAGLNVQQLAAYLGILASTGTPNTGAAMRQLLIQLADSKVQNALMSKYSFIEEEDFFHFDILIGKIRDYVQASGDQAKATREVTEVLGGKANAMQAMTNLLVAEPDLWNQVSNAVKETGSTQSLYEQVTKNTADQLERIRVNINILATQFGSFIAPIVTIVAKVMSVFTSVVVALPNFIKWIIGIGIVIGVTLASTMVLLLGLAGAIAVMNANIIFLKLETGHIDLSLMHLATVVRTLWAELLRATGATQLFGNSISVAQAKIQAMTFSTASLRTMLTGWSGLLIGLNVGMIGYMATSDLMHKQMYDEARIVTLLTSAWLGLSIAKLAVAMPHLAIPLAITGAAVGLGFNQIMQAQISDLQRNERLNAMAAKTGIDNRKNYNVNIQNAIISDEGMSIDDLLGEVSV